VADPLPARLQEILAAPGLPELGPGPRPGVWSVPELERALKPVLQQGDIPETARALARALVLLWHDHLDAAHHLAQAVESPDGSLVHAIMHRREPDFWNSKYWWRRAGKHRCFPELARRVTEWLTAAGARDLAAKLVPHGEWNAFAFVDACQSVAVASPSDEPVQRLREVQQLETETALAWFISRPRPE
jgi:hypothetical protein